MNKTLLASALLLTTISAHAVDAPHWNQASLGFVSVGVDGLEDNFTGLSLHASVLATDNVFFVLASESADQDIIVSGQTVDAEISRGGLGVGYRHGISDTTDIYGQISAVNYEIKATIDNTSVSVDATGVSTELGLRSMATENVELGAAFNVTRLSDDDESNSDTTISLFAAYHFNEKFSLGLNHSSYEDVSFTELRGTMSF